MKENEEVWKNLYDLDNYEISNKGVIRSKDHHGFDTLGRPVSRKGRVLKTRSAKKGKHLFTDIKYNVNEDGNETRKRMTVYLHKAVGEHFLEKEFPDQNHIIHKDGNVDNNDVSNLKWITHSELVSEYQPNRQEDTNKAWRTRREKYGVNGRKDEAKS